MTTPSRSLQHRLMVRVSLGLLAFSLVVGAAFYVHVFDGELAEAAAIERQIVRTVQTQAEVAVYAANARIAEGVIEGLRADPHISAVRIVGNGPRPFVAGAGAGNGSESSGSSEYPLFSPVDGKERVGTLIVVRNVAMLRAEATLEALRQVGMMFLQILATALLIVLSSRHLIGRPVERLAAELAAVRPGSGARVSVAPENANDEIGSLATSANALLEATEKALAEVQELATTDPLTGLPNRRAFMARIEEELSRSRRYAMPSSCLMMLDVDHFKAINDRHGHAAGDAVLKGFGELLRAELREVDMAGRLGGEEFGVLLPNTEIAAGLSFAERLRERVATTTFPGAGVELAVTVSIGIARLLPDDHRPEEALGRADRALYRAKDTGRNRVVSFPEPGETPEAL